MNIREVIEIINVFDVKVIFDKLTDVKDEILQGQSPFYFTPIDGKEKCKYERTNNKSKFISSTATIHIVDLDISELFELFECDGTGIYEYTKNLIKPYCDMGVSEEIVYVTFLFLHEVGHYKQFENMGRNVEKFINKDSVLYKENFKKNQELQNKRIERINNGITCKLTYKEKSELEKYMKEYREISKEKEADEFALKNIKNVLSEYKNKTK
ncbi:hypothetical protein ACV3Z6_13570 [Clostridium perfringens]|uniref:hypothetical protein n=1 Tax=Clostridium perfringens TaxID=1502 RepID=UPI001A2FCDBF|nr:hypothetical protein [Clostridium perfringens]MDN4557946.1 hypothetical protein [Clostridium perfringens]MDT7988283.1 hypothetical protein [Clostridium perfringens]HAT4183908.1 hypothetical protein [Clostridium perfringens]